MRLFNSVCTGLALFSVFTIADCCKIGDVDVCCGLDGYLDPKQIRSGLEWDLKFREDFDGPAGSGVDLTKWSNTRTSAYCHAPTPYCDNGTKNPIEVANKLDLIDPGATHLHVDGNGWVVFTAWEQSSPFPLDETKNYWKTGLITTEKWDGSGFVLLPGDYMETVFQLPTEIGAWPDLWTWGVTNGPRGEVDTYEYHPQRPDILELTSHIYEQADVMYFKNQYSVGPGLGMKMGVHLGENSITWYIDDCRVFSTPVGRGVGSDFRAYIILNLSIGAGLTPDGARAPIPEVDTISFKTDYVHVYRRKST